MLILIGADGESLESKVAKRFGHANYFLMYDTKTVSVKAFRNNAEEHDHKNLEQFLDKGVEVFIVGNIGPHAFELINTPKTSVYLARNVLVKDAIEKLISGELQKLTEPTVKHSIGHNDHNH